MIGVVKYIYKYVHVLVYKYTKIKINFLSISPNKSMIILFNAFHLDTAKLFQVLLYNNHNLYFAHSYLTQIILIIYW